MTPAEKKLVKARINLITNQPFYGTLALRLRLIDMPAEIRAAMEGRGMKPTLAVDGKRIFYAPEFIETLSPPEVEAALAHEIGHCVYEHIGRRGARNPNKWNAAGDYVINASLKNAGFQLGEGWLFDPQYAGMTTDQIYNLLPDMPQGSGPGSLGAGGGPGVPDPYGSLCDILDGESKSDPMLSEEWKLSVASAASAAQQAGKLPADMKRFVDELLNPKSDWRTTLRRFITEISKNDYSWQRPQRKMLANGFYLPSLYSESMGHIVVAIDTSGSITQPQLNIFGSELDAVRTAVRPEKTTVIYCDAAVNHIDEFTAEDPLELKMHGGGGTDFRPPFDYLEREGITPAVFLYMTDGYGPFPEPSAFPAMWCMTTNVEPPWGERIQLDMEC